MPLDSKMLLLLLFFFLVYKECTSENNAWCKMRPACNSPELHILKKNRLFRPMRPMRQMRKLRRKVLGEVGEDDTMLMKPLEDDPMSNEMSHKHRNLASSAEDTTSKVDQHAKFNEHDNKPHYNPKHFDYGKHHGPSNWPKMFHVCGGKSQSPIELDSSTAITKHQPRIVWWNYSLKPRAMTLSNNGHTVQLSAKWGKEEDKPYHWSPPGKEEYVFDQLHFHWGSDDHSGSEHTLNNERFALEMHVVHHRRDLHSLEQAGREEGGIRVIGYFFRISEREHNNTGLQEITNLLRAVRLADTSFLIPQPFPLSKLVPEFSNQYFNYNGSLTTPPCAETVSWVVRKDPLTVSRRQIEEFRSIVDHSRQIIKFNYRPVQPLNGRTVVQIR